MQVRNATTACSHLQVLLTLFPVLATCLLTRIPPTLATSSSRSRTRISQSQVRIYRVFRKNVFFFHNSLQPLPLAYIAVYSHSYWLVFFVQPIAAKSWRGRGGKLSRILEKNTKFNEHLVLYILKYKSHFPIIPNWFTELTCWLNNVTLWMLRQM